jgi:hypothetical protein
MKSYRYDNGTWTAINDTLLSSRLESTDGDTLPPPPITNQVLSSYGFSRSRTTTLVCRTGNMQVHARNHEKLQVKRQVNEFPYDFLCEFTLNDSDIRVWIVDFPSLLRFLSEVEASPEPREERDEPENPLTALIGDSDFQRMIVVLPSLLSKLSRGEIEITVKPPISGK